MTVTVKINVGRRHFLRYLVVSLVIIWSQCLERAVTGISESWNWDVMTLRRLCSLIHGSGDISAQMLKYLHYGRVYVVHIVIIVSFALRHFSAYRALSL